MKNQKSEKIGANQENQKNQNQSEKSGNPWATSFGFEILVKWENIGFGILENMRDLEFRDFGENQEKSEKIRKKQKKSGKIWENQGNQAPVQNPIARESDSVQEPGHQIRKNQIKSE